MTTFENEQDAKTQHQAEIQKFIELQQQALDAYDRCQSLLTDSRRQFQAEILPVFQMPQWNIDQTKTHFSELARNATNFFANAQ